MHTLAPPLRPLTISLRPLAQSDLPASAGIHHLAFADTAVSQLGRATAERYHAALLARADIIALGATCAKGQLAGFCFGGTAHAVEGAFLRGNLGFLAGEILRHPDLLRRPIIREQITGGLQLLRNSNRPSGRGETEPDATNPTSEPEPPRSFTIIYLAVHPDWQGQGVARELLAESEKIARRHGFEQMDLSVYWSNHRAIAFYERAGWQRRIQNGVWKGFMFKPLL